MQIEEYVARRIGRLREYLVSRGLDTAILMKPENTFYFSNFNPVLYSNPAFVIVTLNRDPCLLVHCIRCAHAKEEGALADVQLYGRWGNNVSLAMDPVDAIREILGGAPRKLGLELDYMSQAFYTRLTEKLAVQTVESVSDAVNRMKIVKDAHEIECIRRSASLVDLGVRTAAEAFERGLSEAEACTEGQYRMRQAWQQRYPDSEVSGFGTSEGGNIDSLQMWSLSNEHIAYGCDCPRRYFPKSGDIVLPMAWAKVDGYYAENERTFAVDAAEGVKDRAYDAILKAREHIFRHLRPGVTFESLYLEAAGVFEESGFGKIMPGRTGHGIGLSAHEFPSMTRGNKIPLAPGMVFTVEPGLMDAEWGGARHSDTVLVTDDGYECLTKMRSDKIRLHIR